MKIIQGILLLGHIFFYLHSLSYNFDGLHHVIRKKQYSTFSARFSSPNAEIFDNIFPVDSLLKIDKEAKAGGLGHSVFRRNSQNNPRTSVEWAIESCLRELGDDSPFVEYWWRDEWMSLEAHKDVDELLAREQQILRYPDHGHVLYISIGKDVFGPTILFLEDVYNNSMNYSFQPHSYSSIIVAPATSGRLLRFQGDITHAVPRPPLAYLDAEEGGTNHLLWTRTRIPSDVIDYPDRRSVLLFNTWSNEPPFGVSTEAPSKSIDIYNSNPGVVNAIPKHLWTNVPINRNGNSDSDDDLINENIIENQHLIRLKIGLLGDKLRRYCSSRYIELQVDSSIKEALTNPSRRPHQVLVRGAPKYL